MCTVIVQGVRFVDTTKEPIHPWKPTRTKVSPAVIGNDLSDFHRRIEETNTAKIKKPMITPTTRLTYSIQVFTGLKSFSSSTDGSLSSCCAVFSMPKAFR